MMVEILGLTDSLGFGSWTMHVCVCGGVLPRGCNAHSLVQPTTLQNVIRYLAAEKYPEHLDVEKCKRYAHLAYEAVQTDALKEAIIRDPQHLELFFSFLDHTTEMDPLRCAYFSRIVELLFERYPKELVNFLKKQGNVVAKFVMHINNQYIVESLFRLIDSQASHPWLHEEDLIPLLMIKMAESDDSDTQEKTSQVITEILDLFVPFPYSVLTTQMFHAEVVAEQWEMFTFKDVSDSMRVLNGLNVGVGILSLSFDGNMTRDTPIFMKRVIGKLGTLLELLRLPPTPEREYQMTFGKLKTPFGFLRLKILEFLAALLNTKYQEVVETMWREDLFSTLIELFLAYPWNNTMHFYFQHIVTTMIQCEGEGDGHAVADILLTKCGLLDRIVDAFTKETDRTVGYLGHLLTVARELVRASGIHSRVREAMDANAKWSEFASGTLKLLIERHNTPLVERPAAVPNAYGGEFGMGEGGMGGTETTMPSEFASHMAVASLDESSGSDEDGDGVE